MKHNRIPLLALSAVSVLVCLGAFIVVWILSVDARTLPEKLQSSLVLGLPSALVLIVLLWLGAGLDHLLARIQNTSTRRLVSWGVYLVGPLTTCIGLPAVLILLFTGSLFPQTGWTELPAPPDRPLAIAAAGEDSLVIQTASGQYYDCWVVALENCWSPAGQPQARVLQNSMGDLVEITTAPVSAPPHPVVSLMGVSYSDMGIEVQVHYAVLEDGSVWYLEKDADAYETGFASGLFMTLAVIPAVSGLLVIYLGAGVSSLARRWSRQRSAAD